MNLSEEDKEGVYWYIYEYAMIYIYPNTFPTTPSPNDALMLKKFSNIAKMTPEQLKIKPENLHLELMQLFILDFFFFFFFSPPELHS